MVSCGGGSNDPDELVLEGIELFNQRDFYEARQVFSRAVEADPSARDPLYWLGRTYLAEYMYDSAAFYLKRVDLLYPHDVSITRELLEALKVSGEWVETRRLVEELIRLGDPGEQYYRDLISVTLQSGEHAHSLYYARRLQELNPDDSAIYLEVAHLAANVDSTLAAIMVLDSAIDRFGPDPRYLAAKGLFHAAVMEYDESERIFRGLLAQQPDSPELKLNLANVLSSQDDPTKTREAIALYEEVAPIMGDRRWVDSLVAELKSQL